LIVWAQNLARREEFTAHEVRARASLVVGPPVLYELKLEVLDAVSFEQLPQVAEGVALQKRVKVCVHEAEAAPASGSRGGDVLGEGERAARPAGQGKRGSRGGPAGG
jgi:hypothetical protein